MDKPDLLVSAKDFSDDTVVLVVNGTIDYGSHRRLSDIAVDALARGLTKQVLDLSAVRLCDSTGLSALVRIHRQAEQNGGWVRLVAPSALVRTVLSLTNLDQLFDIRPTVESAVGDG